MGCKCVESHVAQGRNLEKVLIYLDTGKSCHESKGKSLHKFSKRSIASVSKRKSKIWNDSKVYASRKNGRLQCEDQYPHFIFFLNVTLPYTIF